ncbi:Uncharacterised protein [Mycobacterium tuberculosis]|nr:Uncharacterised protein [Mycobacterium tuberculosis]
MVSTTIVASQKCPRKRYAIRPTTPIARSPIAFSHWNPPSPRV